MTDTAFVLLLRVVWGPAASVSQLLGRAEPQDTGHQARLPRTLRGTMHASLPLRNNLENDLIPHATQEWGSCSV